MGISFHSVGVVLPLRRRGDTKILLEKLFKTEKVQFTSLNYIFCTDEFLLKINREFLKHDNFTDIITFDLSDRGKPVEGEVYISLDRVKENAEHLKLPVKDELLRVMVHGALHLCGYKDKTKTEKEAMKTREDYYLKLFNQAQ